MCFYWISAFGLKGPVAYKYLLLSVSLMLIKQQNTALKEILIYI